MDKHALTTAMQSRVDILPCANYQIEAQTGENILPEVIFKELNVIQRKRKTTKFLISQPKRHFTVIFANSDRFEISPFEAGVQCWE